MRKVRVEEKALHALFLSNNWGVIRTYNEVKKCVHKV
jgi:hypothetical protein